MKSYKYISIAFLAVMAAAGCSNLIESSESISILEKEIILTATREALDPGTRSFRLDDGSVWWSPNEEVSVFYGSGSDGGSKFVSMNTSIAETVELQGTIQMSGSGKEFWAVYPYSEDNSCDGTSVTTIIPSQQIGIEGNFSNNRFPAMAKGSSTSLPFWNICGGIKFFVSREDIKSVTFKGNNGESLAGKIKIAFDADGRPAIAEVLEGESEVTLFAPNGHFIAGKYYYITLLPASLQNGFTISFEIDSSTKKGTGAFRSDNAQIIKRSVFGTLKNIDSKVTEWEETEVEDLGIPTCSVEPSELSFGFGEESQSVELLATRDWVILNSPEWVTLSAWDGKASTKNQTISISVNANTEYDRTGKIDFSIGFMKATLTINQKGEKGNILDYGTLDNPYSVAGVIAYTQYLGADVQSPSSVYIKGRVSEIWKSFTQSSSYGYSSFYIEDPEVQDGESFYVFQTYYIGNRRWVKGDADIKVGDDVIIYGPVINSETVREASYIYSLNGNTDGTIPVTDGTISEFIQSDGQTYYRLTGIVSNFTTGTNSSGNKWMQFNLADDTGSVLVYGFNTGEYEKWSDIIKNGGTAVVTGTYHYYPRNEQHEVMNTTIESFDGGSINTITCSVSEATNATDYTLVTVPESVVAALSSQGFIATDGTSNIYVYLNALPSVQIGDKVKIEAQKITYYGLPELIGPTINLLSSGNVVPRTELKSITSTIDSYDASVAEYIYVIGKLVKDGNNWNVEVPGASRKATTSSLHSSIDPSALEGEKVVIKGYFNTIYQSKRLLQIVVTEIIDAEPQAIDLGLPSGLKWASFNVGATKPEEYGAYFAWGETEPKTDYSWSTYKWCNGSNNTQTKYNTKSSYGTVDNKTVLDPEDDAAHVNWGGSWRMPTDAEWTELRTKCTWTWTTQNGVYGWLLSGPNGRSIFLPAAGYRYGSYLYNAVSNGYYRSSSLDTGNPGCAYDVYFNSVNVYRNDDGRHRGQSVRPVSE